MGKNSMDNKDYETKVKNHFTDQTDCNSQTLISQIDTYSGVAIFFFFLSL
jgi:hypothetical protein